MSTDSTLGSLSVGEKTLSFSILVRGFSYAVITVEGLRKKKKISFKCCETYATHHTCLT